MKVCKRCGVEKPKSEFYSGRFCKDGLRAWCKLCTNEVSSYYRKNNIEKIKEINRIYRNENKEKLNEKSRSMYLIYKESIPGKLREWGREGSRRYRAKNPDKTHEATRRWKEANPEKAKECAKRTKEKGRERYKEQRLRYLQANREKILEKNRLHRQANLEKYRKKEKQYEEKNREKILTKKKAYQIKNRDRLSIEHNQYCKKRRNEDPLFKLITNIRTTINRAIMRNSQGGRAKALLGCSIEELKKYLESKFQPDMSWENWTQDGWHIDHILPINSFDLTDPEEQKRCFHYTNLQPLWAIDNLKKHATIERRPLWEKQKRDRNQG